MVQAATSIRAALLKHAEKDLDSGRLLEHYLRLVFLLCDNADYLLYVSLLPEPEQQPIFDTLQAVSFNLAKLNLAKHNIAKGKLDYLVGPSSLVSQKGAGLTPITIARPICVGTIQPCQGVWKKLCAALMSALSVSYDEQADTMMDQDCAAYKRVIAAARDQEPVWSASRHFFMQVANYCSESVSRHIEERTAALQDLLDDYCLGDCTLEWQERIAKKLDGMLPNLLQKSSNHAAFFVSLLSSLIARRLRSLLLVNALRTTRLRTPFKNSCANLMLTGTRGR